MWVDRLFVCVALWQLLTSWGKGGFSSAHRITKLFFKKTSIIFNFYWYIFKACRWKVLIRVSDCLRGFKQELLVTVHFTFTYFVKIWLLFMFSPSLSPSHIFFFSLCSVLDSFLCLFFLTCKKKTKNRQTEVKTPNLTSRFTTLSMKKTSRHLIGFYSFFRIVCVTSRTFIVSWVCLLLWLCHMCVYIWKVCVCCGGNEVIAVAGRGAAG